MKIVITSLLALSLTACTLYPPTAPTPVEPVAVVVERPAVQLSIRIAGPDTWWTDRLFARVIAYDRTGAETNEVVTCQSTDGLWIPGSFTTFSHGSVLIQGVKVGSVLTCGVRDVTTRYTVTALDWRIYQ